MAGLEVFTEGDWSVRSVLVDGEPWFVAADVARALGYAVARDAVRMLDDDEKGAHSVLTPGGEQNMTIITEGGLYSLVLRSQVDGAKAFRRWVTHTVLPQIRRTGSYQPQELTRLQLIELALDSEKERIAAVEARDAARRQLAVAAPKVEAYEAFMDSEGLYSMGAAAQILGYGRTTFFKELRRLFSTALMASEYASDHGRRRGVDGFAGERSVSGFASAFASAIAAVTCRRDAGFSSVDWAMTSSTTSGFAAIARKS
jgi:anti-repressor protein